jgi:hypothetical protein
LGNDTAKTKEFKFRGWVVNYPDGTYVVLDSPKIDWANAQGHVHTRESFERWRRDRNIRLIRRYAEQELALRDEKERRHRKLKHAEAKIRKRIGYYIMMEKLHPGTIGRGIKALKIRAEQHQKSLKKLGPGRSEE